MLKRLLNCLFVCTLLLGVTAFLVGCATPTRAPVGAVVIAPKVSLPPPPLLVQQTEPKPVGYFQRLLLTYFSDSPETLTTSTPPTPAAVQTHGR